MAFDRKAWGKSLDGRWTYFKAKMRERGHRSDLTFEQFATFRKKPCHYCQNEVSLGGYGLDRKDSSRHYTFDNVVACCKTCNTLKGRKAYHAFKAERVTEDTK